MTPVSTDGLERVRTFLMARGWTIARQGERFDDFRAPVELDVPEHFRITIPRVAPAPDLGRYLGRLVETLSEIYSFSSDQMLPVLARASTVLSMAVDPGVTATESVSLVKFDALMDRLRKVLVHTAAFVAEEDPLVEHVPPEAVTYLSQCRFLHTTRGSFVANVELPEGEIPPERPLLDTPPLSATVVNDKLVDVLNYVVGPVLRGDVNVFSDEHIAANLDLINVNVLEDVKGLFVDAGESPLAFSFIGVESTRRVLTSPLTRESAYSFSEYVKFVKQRVSDTFPVVVEGRVVGLRSRNPQRNRNYVLVFGVVNGQPTHVSITLKNDLYQSAIQAHRENRTVLVRGRARRMKTQIRITQIESFTAVAPPGTAS